MPLFMPSTQVMNEGYTEWPIKIKHRIMTNQERRAAVVMISQAKMINGMAAANSLNQGPISAHKETSNNQAGAPVCLNLR